MRSAQVIGRADKVQYMEQQEDHNFLCPLFP